ncbi:hypothetical protein BGX24_001105 [Mortierella sp. AD032]|nr:hypothetical protein BGX24_001105 [Mortierella sp. AD032]
MSNGWSRSEGMFGVHAPQSVDGIPYVYHRGPAGQTPFPTLIAMSGYFPQGTQSTSQQHQQHQHPYGPAPPPLQSNAGPHRSISNHQIPQHHQLQLQQMPYPSPPAQMNEDEKGLDFWRRASPLPSTSATVVDGSGK